MAATFHLLLAYLCCCNVYSASIIKITFGNRSLLVLLPLICPSEEAVGNCRGKLLQMQAVGHHSFIHPHLTDQSVLCLWYDRATDIISFHLRL